MITVTTTVTDAVSVEASIHLSTEVVRIIKVLLQHKYFFYEKTTHESTISTQNSGCLFERSVAKNRQLFVLVAAKLNFHNRLDQIRSNNV